MTVNVLTERPIEHVVFALRPNESFYIMSNKPEQEDYYLVALIPVPAFPGENHPEANGMATICAARYPALSSGGEPKWGWVQLNPDAKNAIGDALLDHPAEIGRWYYMVVSGGLGLLKHPLEGVMP